MRSHGARPGPDGASRADRLKRTPNAGTVATMADEDLHQRFAALSVPEFRRRVDVAIAYVREIRREVAVHMGMTLEQSPMPIPALDKERAERAFQDIIEMLPLLRAPLSPEERAKLHKVSPAEREQMRELVEEMAADPEAFDEAAEELGIDVSSEQVLEIRDSMLKTEMLSELQGEVQAFHDELVEMRDRQLELAEALYARIQARRGQS
jgi:hypothetical protein